MSIFEHIFKAVLTALLLASLSCGGRAFEPEFQDVKEPDRTQVIDVLDATAKREIRSVVVGVGGKEQKLFAWDLLENKMLWSRPTTTKSIPIVAGDLVVVQESEGVIARHLEDGEEAFDMDDEALLVGADGDGEFAVISLRVGTQSKPSGVLVGAQSGKKKWTNDLKLPVGSPVVMNGVVIVPWASHRISLLDAMTGDEQMRFQLNDTLIGRALVDRGSVFAGQHGIFRVSTRIETGNREEMGYYEPLARPFPDQSPFMWDGYKPVPALDDVWLRTRLVWKPKINKDTVGLEDDNLYFLYYRFVFAVAPDDDDLKWIYQSPANVVGAAAQQGGMVLVTESGQIIMIAAKTGLEVWKTEMGISGVQAAYVNVGEFKKEATTKVKPKPLRAQIDAAIGVEDRKLAAGSAFAVRFLANFKKAGATGRLVEICSDRKKPAIVRSAACTALEGRTTGPNHVRESLKKRQSFLKEISAPPSGTLARTAANMGIKGSVSDLIVHLFDPATPASELCGLFEGLGKLGGRPAGEAVEKFLRLYHAETDDKALIEALGKAAEALVVLKKRGARPTLDYIAGDTLASPKLREHASKLSAAFDVPKEVEKKEEAPPEKEAPKDERKERLTGEMVQTVFKPIEQKLRRCIPKKQAKIKIILLVSPTGEIQSVHTAPNTTQKCVEKKLRKRSFPATKKQESEQVVYVIRR